LCCCGVTAHIGELSVVGKLEVVRFDWSLSGTSNAKNANLVIDDCKDQPIDAAASRLEERLLDLDIEVIVLVSLAATLGVVGKPFSSAVQGIHPSSCSRRRPLVDVVRDAAN